MKRKGLFALLALVAVVGFMTGQVLSGEEDPKAEGGPPGGAEMQPPTPPAQMKAFEPFVGEWTSTCEFLPAMFGTPGAGKGTESSKWVLDGWCMMSHGTGTSDFGPHEWYGMATFDLKDNQFKWYMFDSHGTVEVATGEYDSHANSWTLMSDAMDMTGKPAKSKSVLKFVGKDKYEWEWSLKPEGAADFTLWMKGTNTRVGTGK